MWTSFPLKQPKVALSPPPSLKMRWVQERDGLPVDWREGGGSCKPLGWRAPGSPYSWRRTLLRLHVGTSLPEQNHKRGSCWVMMLHHCQELRTATGPLLRLQALAETDSLSLLSAVGTQVCAAGATSQCQELGTGPSAFTEEAIGWICKPFCGQPFAQEFSFHVSRIRCST